MSSNRFAGIILGASLLGWIEPCEKLRLPPEIGCVSGIVDDNVYAGMVIVITVAPEVTPIFLKWHNRSFGDHFNNRISSVVDEAVDKSQLVLNDACFSLHAPGRNRK